jgi:S1-C subfamily serine protease
LLEDRGGEATTGSRLRCQLQQTVNPEHFDKIVNPEHSTQLGVASSGQLLKRNQIFLIILLVVQFIEPSRFSRCLLPVSPMWRATEILHPGREYILTSLEHLIMTAASPQPENLLSALSTQFADTVEQAEQTIVAVSASRRCSASGLHWQPGIIVTVDHAIRQDEEIPIGLADGNTMFASLVGRDSSTDLAVLQVSDLDLPTPVFSSLPLRVGHLVLAVGRASEGSLSASVGMIERLGGSWRSWQGGQIDQLIRPALLSAWGASGSALLDSQGHVIGINTSGPRHMTITIPASTIQRVVTQLLQTGRIARGYLGIGMQAVPIPDRLVESLALSYSEGVMILSVEPDSPADRAGFLIGDVLIALDAQPTTDASDVRILLDADRVGQNLTARVIRAGTIIDLTVTVGERRPEENSETPRQERRRGRGRGRR